MLQLLLSLLPLQDDSRAEELGFARTEEALKDSSHCLAADASGAATISVFCTALASASVTPKAAAASSVTGAVVVAAAAPGRLES